ncbi:Hsp20/alpha crystallin family protein [Verrucomicrobiaceae bacterium R5-34]|uniref:Hsp20/alpha crystallin family protein n=1 Tax=Oceaniferula flava TaxID=2800421 RepID=A0AAE2VBU9_9BACT|nr:Hsp20/alpha crystallin family protein [Oceaniferula flavus]MBK1831470.1 Hsp20/alpha crystallin family protein [Verrucomicrobiaceae bacterium R5-34]MBK1854291.1 Hsp20/alpha crystallin family protein [Oceaniferula flavus]MBM1135597.1 Hsp20/alpha crystallin family protein [Oceaniferula flavus]
MINHYPINNRLFSELDRFVTEAFGQPERGASENQDYALAEYSEDVANNEGEGSEESTQKGWNLRLELPGYKKDEVRLSVDEEFLLITAETSDEERKFLGKIERRVRISDEVDTDNIDARLEDGILYLKIPRKVKAEPKQIVVN